MSETAVERRLREMVDDQIPFDARQSTAIDAGREAIALLKRIDANENASDVIAWDHDRRALLARCEGE